MLLASLGEAGWEEEMTAPQRPLPGHWTLLMVAQESPLQK